MTFSPEQIKQLGEPLNRSHVKSRSQSGRSLSYVEGWHAIAEANRIFGFDGWGRETIEIRAVAESARKIGAQKRDGWGVSYIAKVRVTVGGIVREGIGSGHGIDVDLGLAHESAIKEAETDAMKRALMTFGNQFGLALYDKDQTNVCDEPAEIEIPADQKADTVKAYIAVFKEAVSHAQTVEELRPMWKEGDYARGKLGIVPASTVYGDLYALWVARGKELSAAHNIIREAAE